MVARTRRRLRGAVGICVLSAFAVPLEAQQAVSARPDTAAEASSFSANVGLDANNAGTGTWMQVTPALGFSFGPRWSTLFSVPLYYFNAATSIDGSAAAMGAGDAFATLTLDLGGDTTTFYLTLTGSVPTGNRDKGFGAGRAGWDMSGYLGTAIGRLTPYASGGISNNASIASEALASGTGAGRLVPVTSTDNLFHGETGLELALGRSITLTGSVYGVFASTTTSSTGATRPTRGPRGRIPRGTGGAAAALVNGTDDVSDHGIGAMLWGQVTNALDAGVWVSHSMRFENFTTVSVSANVALSQLGHRGRTHQ